jgi:hypothetical protein
MASSYVNDLRLNEMATGDASGTWGDTTNTNLELIAEAFSYGTEAITTNADTHTTTIADGATDPGRSMYLKYTGTLDSACTITIGPNTVSKVWIIENGTSGSQDIIISQGSGANITIPAGDTKVVYSDGAGAGAAFFDAFASLNVVDLKVQDDLTVTGDIDVDGTTNLDVVDIDGALTQDGGAVFNEASADVDFRVESDNDANALFVQGSDGNVGIGTGSPLGDLSIGRNGNASNGNIQLGVDTNNANKYTAISSKTYASDAQPEGFITLASQAYDGGNETFIGGGLGELDASTAVRFYTAATTNTATGTQRMTITSGGGVVVGNTSTSGTFSVYGPSSGIELALNTTATNASIQSYSSSPLLLNALGNNVGIGTSNPDAPLHIEATNASMLLSNSGRTQYWRIANVESTDAFTINASDVAERLRIDSSGNLLVGTNSGSNHVIQKSAASTIALNINNSNATAPSGASFTFSAATPNDGTSTFFTTADSTAYRGGWLSNGGVQNYQGNNSNLSDEREKKNIEDLSSTWDCVKSWNLRKFHYNEDEDSDDKRLGVIAQEVEVECPEVITEWKKQEQKDEVLWTEEDELPEGVSVGDVKTAAQEEIIRKGVKEQQMYWMAIKALQEAMTEIEDLKARITTLENA